jgi:hypothetical protein
MTTTATTARRSMANSSISIRLLLLSLPSLLLLLPLLLRQPVYQCEAVSVWDLLQPGWYKTVGDFDRINEMLEDDLTPEKNVVKAIELLKEMATIPQEDRNASWPSAQALVTFTSLINLLDPDDSHCDVRAYNILKENERACRTDIMHPDDKKRPLRRIERVIREVARMHADQCFPHYPKLFEALKNRSRVSPLVQEIIGLMTAITKTDRATVLHLPIARQLSEAAKLRFAAQSIKMTDPEMIKTIAKRLLKYMRTKSRDWPVGCYLRIMEHPTIRNRWVIKNSEVKNLFHRFVLSPCSSMEKAFGAVLMPASYEIQLYEESHRFWLANKKFEELTLWLEYYRLCKDMVQHKATITANVIDAIWEEALQ